jgi:hypothetical protein
VAVFLNLMTNLMDLAKKFDKELRRLVERVISETAYRPERFIQMLNEHGGFQTAKILLHDKKLSEGFVKLWELGRLDLTMEAIILKKSWRELFAEEELKIAKKRLIDLGYTLPEPD